MEIPLVPVREPWLPKAVVNGLVSTVILWVFWTPFIVIVAIPLVNLVLNQVICSQITNLSQQNGGISTFVAKTLAPYTPVNLQKLIQVLDPSSVVTTAFMNNNGKDLTDENKSLINAMIVMAVSFVSLAIVLSIYITKYYNLDGWAIFKFNFVMAFVIMMLELLFFANVGVQ